MVLEWLSNVSQPAVDRTYLFDSIPDMVFVRNIFNRPFPSSGLSLSQNESSCKTFHMEMSLICMTTSVEVKHIFI